MNTRQQFKEAVIEALHGKPYEEAIEKEIKDIRCIEPTFTIGRVMQALDNIHANHISIRNGGGILINIIANPREIELGLGVEPRFFGKCVAVWKLTKENKKECTDDDQSEETLIKLTNLLKPHAKKR